MNVSSKTGASKTPGQFCNSILGFWVKKERKREIVENCTRCGYKITGLNFFPLSCKLGNSERCMILACALPSIHGYNFKAVRQTVWQ